MDVKERVLTKPTKKDVDDLIATIGDILREKKYLAKVERIKREKGSNLDVAIKVYSTHLRTRNYTNIVIKHIKGSETWNITVNKLDEEIESKDIEYLVDLMVIKEYIEKYFDYVEMDIDILKGIADSFEEQDIDYSEIVENRDDSVSIFLNQNWQENLEKADEVMGMSGYIRTCLVYLASGDLTVQVVYRKNNEKGEKQ